MHTPDSKLKKKFVSRWRNLTRGNASDAPIGLSTHGLYAYDTVRLLAHAIDSFFKQGGNISFSKNPKADVTGISGPIKFISKDLINPAYEIINVVGTGYRRIGYWGTDVISGFCVDVFTAALNLLPYAVPYKLIPFGDGHNNPSVTELVRLITAGVYDAAVGDIAIITNRTRMVDFTQPYIESGLVVVAPVRKLNSNAWAFLRPFPPGMWGVTAIFFLAVGAVVWILEHRENDDFRGPPRRQVVTVFWFSFSTMFFAHRRKHCQHPWARSAAYMAICGSYNNLKLHSKPDLNPNSATTFFSHQRHCRDLYLLNSPDEYAKALKDGPNKGGVAAVVDDHAYAELFLSTRCEFSIVGQQFTKNGWGFAFPRDSPLAIDMSTAILKLSENGDLQRIHDKWLLRSACSSQGAKLEVDRLQLKSFWGLYLLCGLACLIALFIYFLQIVRQFSRHCPDKDIESTGRSSRSSHIQTFLSFVDDKEEDVKIRSKRRNIERTYKNDDESSSSHSNKRHIDWSRNSSLESEN
ncbi:hypothetical protein Patl1_29291 [Pistacia atlantica]|uniref:Uncharacterized protein n=1 Tax=Pistacia atlantica TaxID=434234 RepID=A0ACC1BHD4_9ROSI|nr:hypothetical protein Patl1_29291 [Pistacia atlantica]